MAVFSITAPEFRAAAKGRKPARLGYAAYVQGSNAMANRVAVGETALSAHTGGSFERVYLHDEHDRSGRGARDRRAELRFFLPRIREHLDVEGAHVVGGGVARHGGNGEHDGAGRVELADRPLVVQRRGGVGADRRVRVDGRGGDRPRRDLWRFPHANGGAVDLDTRTGEPSQRAMPADAWRDVDGGGLPYGARVGGAWCHDRGAGQ